MREEYHTNLLFDGISPESLAASDLEPEPLEFEPGEVIFREGDPGSCFYLIAGGTVRISKGEGEESETLDVAGVNQFFGEMAVIDGQPRSATATAEEACRLGKIDTVGFEQLATASPHITRNFVRALVQRLRATDNRLVASILHADRTSMIGKMTRSIVHDLRNPAQNVLLAADFVADHDDSDELQHVSRLLEKSANRMIRMLQELLDFSKGTPELVFGTHSATKLATDLEEEVLERLSNKGIEVVKHFDYEGEFRADYERLLRVLINMIRNADEAMHTGGRLTVTIATSSENLNLEIGIADTGKGIPEDSLEKIFQPFFTEGKVDGTGIGMSMAKKLVESHGGTIAVTSKVGTGTTFTVTLPLGQGE
jgi:signal transduction histidine kinase